MRLKKLSISDSESSNFILIFAMLIGDFIPENDKVWSLFKNKKNYGFDFSSKIAKRNMQSLSSFD